MKVVISILILLFITLPLRAQSGVSDTSRTAFIRTNSGSQYWGDLLHETADSVYLLQDDGVLVQFPRRGIEFIEYGSVIQSAGAASYNPFWEAGLVLGSPGAVNILAGYETNSIGFRLSGGYVNNNYYGVQLNLLFNLYRGENISHYLSLVWGYSDASTPYVGSNDFGLAYDLNVAGFSFELGMAKTFGQDDIAALLLQLGYVYQFR